MHNKFLNIMHKFDALSILDAVKFFLCHMIMEINLDTLLFCAERNERQGTTLCLLTNPEARTVFLLRFMC